MQFSGTLLPGAGLGVLEEHPEAVVGRLERADLVEDLRQEFGLDLLSGLDLALDLRHYLVEAVTGVKEFAKRRQAIELLLRCQTAENFGKRVINTPQNGRPPFKHLDQDRP